MHKRFVATTIIALGLLFSQNTGLFVAALCPHLQSNDNSCETSPAPADASHHDMDHMQMEAELADSSNPPDGDAIAVGKANGQCSHCAVHSRTSRNGASLQQSNVPQREGEPTGSAAQSPVGPIAVSKLTALPSRAHGPPGHAIPRHILINIFRI